MPNIGPMELAIVAVIALLVLGPKRLPQAGRSLGRGIREFKDAVSGAGDRSEEAATPSAGELPLSTAGESPLASAAERPLSGAAR